MVKKILFLTIFLFSSYFVAAQSIEVAASTDNDKYLIGDYIYYTIRITYDENITPLTPVVKDSITGLEFLFQEDVVTGKIGNKLSHEYNFIFSKYDSGTVNIPSITLFYQKENDTLLYSVKTDQKIIRVDLVEIDPEGDIKDIKDPLTIPLNWKTVLFWVIIILLFLILIYFLYKKFRNRKIVEGKNGSIDISKPPHEAALESLKELELKELWQNGFVKEYHSEITGIIRKYFEERFEIPALESTTGELLSLLNDKDDADEILSDTENFLSNADLVKFAKFQPMDEVNKMMMIQAYDIVNKTRQTFSNNLQGEENVR